MYTGYKYIKLTEEELAEYYQNGLDLNRYPLLNKEYGIIYQIGKDEPVEYIQRVNDSIRKVKYPKFDSNFAGKTKPRNPEQYCAMDLLKDDSTPVKLITGRFGSGKTLLCATAAFEALENNKFDKIVFVRNNVQVADTVDMGALPGDIIEKSLQFVMPLADHAGGEDGLRYLIQTGKLEVIPLAFLRGRSIRNAILYSTEAENLTLQHIQLLLGRVDEGSQIWLDGDGKQRDGKVFTKSKGLETMIEKFKGHKNFGYINLVKSERSEVAAMADLLDEEENNK